MPSKKIFMVTLELTEPSAKYSALYEYLKSHIGWNHYLPAMWLIVTEKPVEEFGKDIQSHIFINEKGGGDRYLAADITRSRYFGWGPKPMWEWLQKQADEIKAAEAAEKQQEFPKVV